MISVSKSMFNGGDMATNKSKRSSTAGVRGSKNGTSNSAAKVLIIVGIFGALGLLYTYFASAASTIRTSGYEVQAAEGSGMVASRQYPGVYWWHRDGGTSTAEKPRNAIYAMKLDVNGVPQNVRGTEKYPFYSVDYKNTNWEDIAIDDSGNLWLGDIGANKCERNNQTIVKMKEPNPSSTGAVTILAKYTFKFPDPASGCNTWNSEAMFWLDGKLYIFAKTNSSPVYRVDLPSGSSGTAKLVRLGSLAGGISNISVSSVSADRGRLMVAAHQKMNIYATTNTGLKGDAWVRDIISRPPVFTSSFDCACSKKPNVEGGTYALNSRDVAFVSEGKLLYYAKPNQYGDTVAPSTQTGDTKPPTVAITSPTSYSTVKGTIVVSVEASDNKEVETVNVFFDETGIIREGDEPGKYGWGTRFNTNRVSNGLHTLNVTAYDAAGNKSSAQVYIRVNN